MVRAIIVVISFLLLGTLSNAQEVDTSGMRKIVLDSFVVRSGFSMSTFIRKVQQDTTFYKAFKSLHLLPYRSDVSFTAYNKRGAVEASMKANAIQQLNGKKCWSTKLTNEVVTGKFYNKQHRPDYFTAELFYSLFFSDKQVCGYSDVVADGMQLKDKSRLEKSKYELKQLMFNPGAKISGVPFMGDRASIFDADEIDKYDMKVTTDTYEGEEVYIFRVTPKPRYENKVVFSELKTWFRRSDYSIVARDYSLAYNTLFYDFDVHMKVRMKQMNGKIYPSYIDYDGNWKVATKDREKMKVIMKIEY